MPPKFRRVISLAVVAIAILALSSCTVEADDEGGTEPVQPGETAEQSDDDSIPDEPIDPPASADVELASRSASLFGFDLFRGLAEIDSEENVITSPYSGAVLLSLLLNGADGETREAIGSVLHLEDPRDDEINAHHSALAEYLMAADPDVELAIANSLWLHEDMPFEDEYLTTMRETFEAQIETADLASQEAADRIDEWVSEQTRERIEEIAEDLDLPSTTTILVLVNAIHFLSDWTIPFDPEDTTDGNFRLPDGSTIETPLMSQIEVFPYAEQDGFEVLRMPYGEEERFAMEVFLPESGLDLNEFRERLDYDLWNQAVNDLTEQQLRVTMPSFEIEYDTEQDMDDVLKELGMGIAYTDADFSLMTPAEVWLDSVLQKTYLKVDEVGTEAAAVTAGDLDVSEPPDFSVNRPFLFTISDVRTRTILFLGQVTDPSK